MMVGIKDVENRSWRTSFRGTMFVLAGRVDRLPMLEFGHLLALSPPADAILGTVEVVGCVGALPSPSAIPGQRHWILDDPPPLPEPIPCKGALGLWTLPTNLNAILPAA